MNRSRLFLVVALGVAGIAFGVIAFSGINKNLVYYWTPNDLRLHGQQAYGATIRLGGQVAPGTVRQLGRGSGVEFDVTDRKALVHVKSNGIPPQMFREGIGVVVEGTMVPGGYFQSDRLMVSHNNEYKAPKSGETVDAKELIRTTNGVEPK
ncbi:MAG TPA: cytochrome c maturation protein CcmE [Thermoanaerobaculia bacterium]|nr:cytochrome c maturation protein CcmE [Thermoanaerobaculia bacterium]